MPTASDEQRDRMTQYFGGDGIDDAPVIAYLESRGYKLRRGWTWANPSGIEVSQKDIDCFRFLIEEWDFGGLCDSGSL